MKDSDYENKREKYLKALTKRVHPSKIEDVDLIIVEDESSFSIKMTSVNGIEVIHTKGVREFGACEWEDMYTILCKKPRSMARDQLQKKLIDKLNDKSEFEFDTWMATFVSSTSPNDPNIVVTSPQKKKITQKKISWKALND